MSNCYNKLTQSFSKQAYLLERRARRTFTIDPDVSEKIDILAGGHNIEINVLVNRALRRFIEWGRYVDNFKLVTSDPRLMKVLWSHISIDDARRMGTETGNDAVAEFILYYFHKFDLDSVLKTFRVIGAEYCNAYVYSEFGDQENRTVILRHSVGRAASAYYGSSLKALCSRLGLDLELEESDDQVICKIAGGGSLKGAIPKNFKEQMAGKQIEKPAEVKISHRIIVDEKT